MRHHLPRLRQKAARHVQSWARHATSFVPGAAKDSTTRAKQGTTCDIICRGTDKRRHVTCEVGHDTRHLLFHVRRKIARLAQLQSWSELRAIYASFRGGR